MKGQVSDALRKFVAEYVENYEEIEILVLLHAEPDRVLSAHEIASRLGMDERAASSALDGLGQDGLLAAAGGGHKLASDHRPQLDELARVHRHQRSVLLELLVELALNRLRTSNIQAFADAFKLRGGK